MKKLIYFVVFLLIALALTPVIDGYLFKRQFYNLIAALNRDNITKINVIDYHMGWLSSAIKIKLTHPLPNMPTHDVGPIELMLEENVAHGPIVYDKTKEKFTIAIAMIESHLHVPSDLEKILLGTNQPKGILQITTMAAFGNKWQSHIQIPIMNVHFPKGGQLIWQGLTGDIFIKIKNQHVHALESDIVVGAISVTEPANRQLNIQPVSLSYNGIFHPVGLWVGNFKIKIPSFLLKTLAKGNIIYIENLNGSTENNISSHVFYNGSQQIALQKLELPQNNIISSLNLIFGFENFSAPGIVNLTNFLKNTPPYMVSEVQSQVFLLATKVFTPTSLLNGDVSFNTSFGPFLFKGKASKFISATSTSFAEMIKSSDIEMNIRIAIPLANKLSELYFQTFNEKNGGLSPFSENRIPPPPAPIAQDNIERFNQKIADLMKQGRLTLNQSMQLMTINIKGLPLDQFTAEVKELKLPADIQSQILKQYNQVVVHAPVKPIPTHSPQELAKEMINEWVKLGFLIQNKNDYLMAILLNNGEVKVNGKIIDQHHPAIMH